MTVSTVPSLYSRETLLIRVAREIAIDFKDLETILKHHQLSPKEFDKIKKDPRFLRILEGEILAWNAATNTHERTKLKAAALVEEWLVEANARINDPGEHLSAKTELVKLLTRIAGMGVENATVNGAGGERFVVNINLGEGRNLTFAKEVTPKVIDGTVEVV